MWYVLTDSSHRQAIAFEIYGEAWGFLFALSSVGLCVPEYWCIE
jgi:cytochrome c oxidase subunit IV